MTPTQSQQPFLPVGAIEQRSVGDLRWTKKSPTRRARLGTDIFWFVSAWLCLLSAWELGVHLGWLNGRILPPPSQTLPYAFSGEVAVGFGMQHIGLFSAAAVTLMRVAAGMLGGLAASMILAVAVVQWRPARRLLMPLAQSLAPIAPVAWIPFTIAVIGIGGPAATFIVFITVIGSITLALVAALDAIPEEYLRIARNLGTPTARLWWRVRLPAIAPSALVALRMSFFGAWMAVLAGEMAGINSGLGYLIIMAQQVYNMKLVMVGILTIGVIGFAVDRLLLIGGQRIVWWER